MVNNGAEKNEKKSAIQMTLLRELSGEIIDFERLINLIRAKAWLVIVVAAIFFAASFAYVLRSPKIYESRALIQVEQSSQNVVNIDDVNRRIPRRWTLSIRSSRP